jgi:hypothetical protein
MSSKDRDPPAISPRGDPPDPDAPPSEAELAAALELRRSLEQGGAGIRGNADWELVEAVRAAASPAALAEVRHRRILEAALSRSPKGRVIYLAFGGVASLAAMAAALAIVMKGPGREPIGGRPMPEPPMAVSRSTTELFPAGIPARGSTSDRVDRIAYARARDLRENRFARWGVR